MSTRGIVSSSLPDVFCSARSLTYLLTRSHSHILSRRLCYGQESRKEMQENLKKMGEPNWEKVFKDADVFAEEQAGRNENTLAGVSQAIRHPNTNTRMS